MNSPTSAPRTVAVVGGGITGLTAAFRLATRGFNVSLFEASNRLGGAVGSERIDGWLIEAGPNSLLEGEKALGELVRELGLQEELVAGGAVAKNRFIVRDSRLQALPMSPPALLTTRLFSAGMKFRVFSEMLKKPRTRPSDVSLEQFILEHFGQEAVDYGLNPFVSGVYAGDPALLSARHAFAKLWEIEQKHGSIIKGQIAGAKERKASGAPKPRIVSFRKGLQALIDALASKLPAGSVRMESQVRRIEAGPNWRLSTSVRGETVTECFDRVLLAVPAGALAQLEIGRPGDRPLSQLSEIVHPPVSSLFLGYRREQVAHPLNGFGALIPAVEKRKELGLLFSSSLFDGRAPEGHVAITVMVGGMRQPEIGRLSQTELLETIQPDLRDLLGVSGEPVFQRFHSWPAAIPQYNLGYERFLGLMASCEKAHTGLFIGGNSRDGISVPNCIVSGLRLAACVEP